MNDLMEYSKRMVGVVRKRLGNHPAVKKDGYMNSEQFATCVRAYYPDIQIASVVKDGREYRHATVIHGSLFPHSFTVRLDCGSGKVSTYAHGLRMPVSLVPGIGTGGGDVESCPCGMGDVRSLSPAYCSGVNGLTVLTTVALLFLWYSLGRWMCGCRFRGHGWAGLLAICAGFCAEGAWTGSMYDAGGLWPALGAALAWPYGVYAGFNAMKEVLR